MPIYWSDKNDTEQGRVKCLVQPLYSTTIDYPRYFSFKNARNGEEGRKREGRSYGRTIETLVPIELSYAGNGLSPSDCGRQQFKRNSRRLRERTRDKSVIHITAVCKIYARQGTHSAVTDLTASVAIRVLSRTACTISAFPVAFVQPSNAISKQTVSIRTQKREKMHQSSCVYLRKKHYSFLYRFVC